MTLDRAAASPGGAGYDVKGELIRDGDVVTGWCWSPECGHARLRVSLLIDGAVAGSTIAARLRADLVRDGVCDGYHGFSLPLPAGVSRQALIETRESVTGRMFGRILPGDSADVQGWRERVDALAAQVAQLHCRASALETGGPRCLDGFGAVGVALLGRGRPGERAGPPAHLRLASSAAPQVCLIIDGRGGLAPAATRAVRILAPMLRHYQAEMVLIDDGMSPASAAFARVPGLRCGRSARTDDAVWFNTAAAHAAAPRLIFLRTDSLSAPGLIAILEQSRHPAEVLIGGGASMLARRLAGGTLDGVADVSALPGLCLQVLAATLDDLGGLDPLMDDGGDLAVLDLAIRARKLGHHVCLSDDRDTAELNTAPRTTAAASTAARRHFASTWRRLR